MKIKDIRQRGKAVEFQELKVGECFIDDENKQNLCIKTDSIKSPDNVVILNYGHKIWFRHDHMVIPVTCELNIVE